jgi:hypothetical protein
VMPDQQHAAAVFHHRPCHGIHLAPKWRTRHARTAASNQFFTYAARRASMRRWR